MARGRMEGVARRGGARIAAGRRWAGEEASPHTEMRKKWVAVCWLLQLRSPAWSDGTNVRRDEIPNRGARKGTLRGIRRWSRPALTQWVWQWQWVHQFGSLFDEHG